MAASSMKDIKNRIKSVRGTMQITKAMELVASSKLRRAKEKALRTRPYFEILKKTIDDIAQNNSDFSSVYTKVREVKKKCFVVIAGDRGLAGGYNSNVLKSVAQVAGEDEYVVLPIGKKTGEYFARRDIKILSEEYMIAEAVSMADCSEIGMLLAKKYSEGEFDELYIVYTKFISVLTQEPELEKVLPVVCEKKEEKASREMMIYEPSAQMVFSEIVPQYISGVVYGGLCEAQASEFAARRTAMESANKNAGEMIESLNLSYNRARQAAITQELTEIVSGAEALK